MSTILITGGAGYIGSHTAVELLNAGYDIVLVDNYYNASEDVVGKIKVITGKDFKDYNLDVCDKEGLKKVFLENDIDAVIHFAGYKAVGESCLKPLMYYRNNMDSTITLLEVMEEFNVKKFVFSSSATVYGDPERLPIDEKCSLHTTSPYGSTKLYIEGMLSDVTKATNDFRCAVLRYFNPVGAHDSGLIGEKPNGIPNNLMPYILQVSVGNLDHLNVYGNDYDTKDGTGVRDYIHVVDLAKGHVAAIKSLDKYQGIEYYNLGTGVGYSVLEMVKAFEKVNGIEIPYVIAPRRPGDIATCFASTEYANKKLGWKAELGLEDMMSSGYTFIKNLKK